MMECDGEETVHIGFVNDFDGEDADDNISAIKAAADLQIRTNKSTNVQLHYIMDCGARRQYFDEMLGWLYSQDCTLPNGNAKCIFYLAPGVGDAQRKAEVEDRLFKGHGGNKIDICKYDTERMLPVEMFPWRDLRGFVVASPQYGIPMSRIQEMPKDALVYMTGDAGSVNARPQGSFETMLHACKKVEDVNGKITTCPSRLVLFPPIDPKQRSGYTRQCTTPGSYMTLFNVLANSGTNVFSENARSLAESTRRSIADRPTNERNAMITDDDMHKFFLYENGKVYINGVERDIEWGSSPRPIISNNGSVGGVIKNVDKRYVTLADNQYFNAPPGVNRRRRISLSNQISANGIIACLKPLRQKILLILSRDIDIQGIDASSQDASRIEVLAEKIVGEIMNGKVVLLLDRQDHELTNLSSRLSTYSEKFISCDVGPDTHEHIPEWQAIMNCMLATLFLFGDVLCEEPQIKMDTSKMQYVIGEIQNPTYCIPQGEIRETTPNYDSCVVDTAFQCIIHGAQISNLNHEIDADNGHMVICNQSAEVVNAYRRRDKAHVEHTMQNAQACLRVKKSNIQDDKSMPQQQSTRCRQS